MFYRTNLYHRFVIGICFFFTLIPLSAEATEDFESHFSRLEQRVNGDKEHLIIELRNDYNRAFQTYSSNVKQQLKRNRSIFQQGTDAYYIHMITEMNVYVDLKAYKEAAYVLYTLDREEALKQNAECYTYFLYYAGYYFLTINDHEKCIRFLNSCEQMNERIGRPKLRINVLHHIGIVYGQLEDLTKSEYYINKAHELAKQYGIRDMNIIADLGILAMLKGDYKKSEALMLSIYDEKKNTNGIAELNLGFLYLQMKQYEKAKKQAYLALALGEKLNDPSLIGDAYNNLYEVFKGENQLDQAVFYAAKKDSMVKVLDHQKLFQTIDSLQTVNFGWLRQKDLLQSEQKMQSEVKEKRTWMVLSLIILFVTLGLSFYLVRLRKKHNQLVLVQLDKMKSEKGLFVVQDELQKSVTIDHQLLAQFERLIIEQKWYRKEGVTLAKVAKKLGTNTSDLSELINVHYQQNFRTIINERRIAEAKIMLSEADGLKFSMEGIATTVGYKNNSTFYKNFKEITGVTPAVFQSLSRKILKKEGERNG